MTQPRKTVAVVPAAALDERRRLFDTLEAAYPARFEGRALGELSGTDAAIAVGVDPGPTAVPTLVALAPEDRGNGVPGSPYHLCRETALDSRLHGHRLHDAARPAPVEAGSGDAVLAKRDRVPLWVSRANGGGRHDTVALAPAELGPEEGLRERVNERRSLALLPLIHFLRRLTAELDFAPPPPRAAFLLDDPNLHWASYGHVRYPELARHAERHGYHVAMAMVPLDGWLAHPGAARLFRERADRLSLVYHGNDHVLRELASPSEPAAARSLLAQARRRIARFERRTRLQVARVMAAPHGDCSELMAREMLRLGFEALSIDRPYPWLARRGDSRFRRPTGSSALLAVGPATLVAGGLPVVMRRSFEVSAGELALMAFFDQPLVIYGHHEDLEDGPEPLAELRKRVDSIAPARWTSLDEIAATNHATRLEGDLLRVKMHGRRARLNVPAGAERIRVELPPGHDGAAERVVCGTAIGTVREELALPSGLTRTVDLRLVHPDAVDPHSIPRPGWSPWPVARRVASEGRDRIAPLYRRTKLKRNGSAADGLPAEW